MWDLSGNLLQVFKGHESDVYSVAFSPDGKNILTGSYDKTARLWDLEGNELQVFKGHEDGVFSVAFSPDGKSVLTESSNTARLWDLDGNLLQIFRGHEEPIFSVTFSPDGKSILTGSRDNTARLWKVKPLNEFQSENNYENLSISNKIEFELINYKDVIALINEEELFDGANYYFNKAGLFQKEKKIEYLNNALKLYNKLISIQKKGKYYTGLHNIYTILQKLEPANRNTNEQEKILNELMNLNNEEDLLEGADYFFYIGIDIENDSIQVQYYKKAILLFEKIMVDFPESDVKEDAFTCYNNLSLAQLFAEQYSEALINAKKGLALKDDEIIYTKLALAYIFNNKYEEAKVIIGEHKEAIVNEISFGEYILNKLNELEEAAITHPDVGKVRALLKE